MDESRTPTRRQYLVASGSLLGTGAVAGCSDIVGSGDGGDGTATPGGSYSGTLEPMGTLTLDSPPESWVGDLGFVADLLTALGHGDGAVGMADPRFWYTGFYDELDGVNPPNPDDLARITTEDRNTDIELLYEIDPELMALDPNGLISIYGLDEAGAAEIRDRIAPWFGNGSRRKRFDGWTYWPDGEEYPYYSLPEYVPEYAGLFGERQRGQDLLDFYRPVLDDVTSRVPPESERSTMALVNGRYNPENRDGWIVYDPTSEVEKTWGKKHFRDLGVVDAFEGDYDGQSAVTVGYEGLLERDPDVIVFHFGVTYRDFQGEDFVTRQTELLRDDPVGSQLTAVQNGDLYLGGTPYQGPLVNLFQTEMLAKQLYPEEFGEWRGVGEVPANERLFDRDRLAEIATREY
jgi:iron complex transport system substrate-binding protein